MINIGGFSALLSPVIPNPPSPRDQATGPLPAACIRSLPVILRQRDLVLLGLASPNVKNPCVTPAVKSEAGAPVSTPL